MAHVRTYHRDPNDEAELQWKCGESAEKIWRIVLLAGVRIKPFRWRLLADGVLAVDGA